MHESPSTKLQYCSLLLDLTNRLKCHTSDQGKGMGHVLMASVNCTFLSDDVIIMTARIAVQCCHIMAEGWAVHKEGLRQGLALVLQAASAWNPLQPNHTGHQMLTHSAHLQREQDREHLHCRLASQCNDKRGHCLPLSLFFSGRQRHC